VEQIQIKYYRGYWKMKMFALSCALFLCSPWIGCANSKENNSDALSAKGTLLRLFKANDIVHGKSLDWGNPKVTGQYFGSDLVKLLQLNHACEVATKEVCNLNSDPVFNAQDYDDKGIKTEILSVSTDSVLAFDVKIINLGEQILKFEMSKEGESWRVSDIKYPNSMSLKRILQEELPEH
jgi:hypothetical protein